MSLYKGQDLFASGPHAFRVHGVLQRHQLVEQPGVDGARVVALGRAARVVEQFGILSADTVAQLAARVEAVENAADGAPGELIDDLGRTWPRMVLLEFNPARFRRAATRWSVNYVARYVQTQPEPVAAPTAPADTDGLI